MSLRVWDDKVVPRLTDRLLRGREIGVLRGRTSAGLAGHVIELGFGSGLNLRWYPEAVTAVDAVEPADTAWHLSGPRRSRTALPVRRVGLDGQHLDLPDDSYDAALVTFSLCTIPDHVLALRELRRVLRPGAAVHFLEHGISPDPGVRRWQHRLDPLESALGAGCRLTRSPAEALDAAGWSVESIEEFYLPGPAFSRPWSRLSLGVAR
ncbi:MAG: class I SAM-dependent methyltransferase [Nocardioides sp.]|nr:class I SAM-dependent methyltransferase [Nocardioides sp.]